MNRQDARSALRSVAYISRLLAARRDRALAIFPQGEITPNDRRPLTMFSGMAHVAQRAGGATLWPVALRYEFRGEQRPEAFIRAGPAHYAPADSDARALTAEAGARLTAACDALRDEVTERPAGRHTVCCCAGDQGRIRSSMRRAGFLNAKSRGAYCSDAKIHKK